MTIADFPVKSNIGFPLNAVCGPKLLSLAGSGRPFAEPRADAVSARARDNEA